MESLKHLEPRKVKTRSRSKCDKVESENSSESSSDEEPFYDYNVYFDNQYESESSSNMKSHVDQSVSSIIDSDLSVEALEFVPRSDILDRAQVIEESNSDVKNSDRSEIDQVDNITENLVEDESSISDHSNVPI
ncbi:hypothetical protein LOTGIDRAFT_162010 [Lottia gigantea]|uniref:Uncharacterized protein n=1 Tax=Lottia gigantea TaxID=225164 RepID=V4BVD9_LOTGI|nr:hypothetical protein LOTGIDRAFT_162010 [Lottia gigantea]ESO92984.1 hypothetical protein LOTGIDRAFT_162010 [Lottia gigantea]